MSTCARCGHELGVGRFCTNCGHPIGQPVPESEVLPRLDDLPLPDQAGPSTARPAWMLPAVGLVLLLVLLGVLASCLGDDDADERRSASARTAAASQPSTTDPDDSLLIGTRP
jgi:hypothetical protein